MDDERVWAFEESLWTVTPEHYRDSIDEHCLMALPSEPHLLEGRAAMDAVIHTPRWTNVALTARHVARPQESIIVVAYTAHAERAHPEHGGAQPYLTYCTSTYRRLEHEVWKVIQHSQTPPLVSGQA